MDGLPQNLVEYNMYPTFRGGLHPVSGNGSYTGIVISVLNRQYIDGYLPTYWDEGIRFENISRSDSSSVHVSVTHTCDYSTYEPAF